MVSRIVANLLLLTYLIMDLFQFGVTQFMRLENAQELLKYEFKQL